MPDRTDPLPGFCVNSAFVAIGILVLLIRSDQSFAQGKLSQLRSRVRPAPTQVKHKSRRNRQREQENDDHNSNHSHRHNSRDEHSRHERRSPPKRRRGGCPTFSFSSHSVCRAPHPIVEVYPSPVIVAPVHIYEVPIAQAYQPVTETALIDSRFVGAPVPGGPIREFGYENAHQSTASNQQLEPPVLIAPGVVEQVYTDWFTSWAVRGNAMVGGGSENLTVAGGALLIQAPSALGLDVSAKTWRENSTGSRDHLWLGDVNLVFEFANSNNVRARLGGGLNWLGDHWGSDVGFNLTAGLDLKMTERWIVSAEGDVGTLGASDYLHSQISLSRRFQTTELMVGYDYYDLGGVQLQAAFGGLQFRF